LEIVMPLAHGGLQPSGDLDHGGFAFKSLAQIERLVFGVVIGSSAAGGLATAAGHDNEAAVQKTLSLVEELVEFAANLPFVGWQQRLGNGLGWHGLRRSKKNCCIHISQTSWKKLEKTECENAPIPVV
jgi:hypothetical protein